MVSDAQPNQCWCIHGIRLNTFASERPQQRIVEHAARAALIDTRYLVPGIVYRLYIPVRVGTRAGGAPYMRTILAEI